MHFDLGGSVAKYEGGKPIIALHLLKLLVEFKTVHFVHAICDNQQVWTQIPGELQGRVAGGSGRNMVKALLEKKGAQLAGFIRVPLDRKSVV